eukprot:m.11159 g.11159  ORF g.11159 m.11159 type:complete len:595 (-) comp3945_c0_seq1:13-1797(-)
MATVKSWLMLSLVCSVHHTVSHARKYVHPSHPGHGHPSHPGHGQVHGHRSGAQPSCPAAMLPHSNRSTAASTCAAGVDGTECFYSCDQGFIPIGRHVCQTYATQGHKVITNSYAGGRCARLCANSTTHHQGPGNGCAIPLRYSASDAQGACLATVCFDTADGALRHLARSNYALWQLARNPSTGLYLDHVKVTYANETQTWSDAHLGVTGLGLVFECVAHAMGWLSSDEAQHNVLQTLTSLTRVTRGRRGFIPTVVDSNTGKSSANLTKQGYALMATGLNTGGVMFARTYFAAAKPQTPATRNIVETADAIFNAIQFDSILCGSDGRLDPNGDGIPMLAYPDDRCSAAQRPQPDGYYGFNEEHYTVWFAFEQACGGQPAGQCTNKAIERMWNAWQGRRHHPNLSYQGNNLLSLWSSYLVQLPFMVAHSFNSDATYRALFKSHWEADRAFYRSPAYYAGSRGRYGLGAGPTESWCAGGGYLADQISTDPAAGPRGAAHCRNYSPYGVAGYMPADPETVTADVLALMHDGETTLSLPLDTKDTYHVLGRKSIIDLAWNQSYDITMVDMSSQLFGLSTLWLTPEFYSNYSNHWARER